MKTRNKHGRYRGFTLIELLTVVAIIGILVTLTVAVGSYIRNEANRRETQGNIEILAGAVDKFQQVFDVYPPDGTEADPANPKNVDRLNSGQVLMRILTGEMKQDGVDGVADAKMQDYFYVFRVSNPSLSQLKAVKANIQQQITPLLQKLTAKCYSTGASNLAPKDAWNKDMIYLKTQGASGKPAIISAGPDHYFGTTIIDNGSERTGAEADNVRSDSKK